MVEFSSPGVLETNILSNMQWSVRHQVILLGALQRYGCENWEEIADFLSEHSWFKKSQPISQEACRVAYTDLVRSFFGPEVLISSASFGDSYKALAQALTNLYVETVKKEVESTQRQLKELETKEPVYQEQDVSNSQANLSTIPVKNDFSSPSIKTSESVAESLTPNSLETLNILKSPQASAMLDPSIMNKMQVQKRASKATSMVSPVKVDTIEPKLEIILEEPSANYPANKLKRTFAQPLRTSPSKRPQSNALFKGVSDLSPLEPLILVKSKRTSARATQKLNQPKSISSASIQSPVKSSTTELIPISQDISENAKSSIIDLSQSVSGNPISKEDGLKEAIPIIPVTESNVNVAGSVVPSHKVPEVNVETPLIPKRDDNNAISSRTRRASRGDTTIVTQPIKKLRSSKKIKDDANLKAAAPNPKVGYQVPGMNLSKRNLSTNSKAMVQLSPAYHEEFSTPNPSEMPNEDDLQQQGENNVSQNSPLNLAPIASQNLDLSVISSPIIVSDPSDTNIDDVKRQISCSPQESSVDSDVEHCLFGKSGAQNNSKLRSSSQPLIHSALQEFSSGSITPIKSYSNSFQMSWLDTAQYKTWKKLAQMVLKDIAHHRLAPLFQRPIKESLAPGYYSIVKRPMDLSTIQSRIKNGVITTTEEFTRDVLLMCQNALMFNRVDTEIHQMAQEMLASVKGHLETLNAAVLYNSTSQQHLSTPVFPPPKQ